MGDSKTSIIISAEDRTREAFESAKNGLQGLEQAASRLPLIGASLAGFASIGALTASIKSAIDFGGKLNDMAMQTGATVEQLSALRDVAELSGVSLDEAGKGLQKLSKAMLDAGSGGKESAALFKALGVAITDSSGGLRDSGAVMQDVAKAIASLESPTERVAAAQLAFGKSGAALVPMLMDIAKGGELVATWTEKDAALADEFGDNLEKIAQHARATGEAMAKDILPSLVEFSAVLEKAFRPGLVEGFAQSWGAAFKGMAAAMDESLASAEEFLGKITSGEISERHYRQAIEHRLAAQKLYQQMSALQRGDASAGDAPTVNRGALAKAMADAKGEKGTRGKTDLQRMEELGQKNLMDAYYATAGEETMREVADKRAIESAKARAKAVEDLANAEQRLIDMTDSGKLAKFYDQADLAKNMLMTDKIDFEQYNQIIDKLGGVQDKAKETGSAFEDLAKVIDGWGKQSAQAIADFVVDGKGNLSDLVRAFAKEMVAMIAYQNGVKQLSAGIGSWIGGLSTTANADGAVYESPSLSRYSNGVYDSPKLFAFAQGVGVFAEAGPEAIMPLKRGPDGKLGVQASGSSPRDIRVDISVDARGSRVQGEDGKSVDLGARIGAAVRSILIEEQRPGGLLAA